MAWRGLVAVAVATLTLVGCSTSAPGEAAHPSSSSSAAARGTPAPQARDLLLQTGEITPFGPSVATDVGSTYFTGVRPADCTAAVLFKNSPLPPADPVNHAESAYHPDNKPGIYAESIGVYDRTLNPHDVVANGFSAVSKCNGDAMALTPQQPDFGPLKLSNFTTPSDGVLVWTMTRKDWNCDYGMAVVSQAVLMMSACDSKPGFPMADWATKRRAQIDNRG